MVRGTEHSSSSACLELAMRGREDCIGIHRAFGIDRNFGIPQQERADAAVFRVRDMKTIASLEQGISCPSDVPLHVRSRYVSLSANPRAAVPFRGRIRIFRHTVLP